ncbi:pilin, partial [Patescibacteria group bacterium]|nr:pilin [Patescibacteria group bacterium]
ILFFIANLFYYPLPVKSDAKPPEDCPITIPGELPGACDWQTKDDDSPDDPSLDNKPPSGLNATMPNFKMPDLQIKIPGLTLTNIKSILSSCEKDEKGNPTSCAFPWISEYIAGIYKYAIGIVGILAAVVLMIGGVLWIIAGGNATAIGEAKSWIAASLTGLVIALCSYTILYQVNPNLLNFKPLTIGIVQEIEEAEDDYTESGGGAPLQKGSVTYAYNTPGDINRVTSNTQKFLSNLENLNLQMRITSLITGHRQYVKGTNTLSPHAEGRGVDIGCSPEEKDQCINLTKIIANKLGGSVTQIIYCMPGATSKRNGKIYNNYQEAGWSDSICSGHMNHIHISVNK